VTIRRVTPLENCFGFESASPLGGGRDAAKAISKYEKGHSTFNEEDGWLVLLHFKRFEIEKIVDINFDLLRGRNTESFLL
jgi:hypothetical protein